MSESVTAGFNAARGEYADMGRVGVIDPAKATRSALQNAASIAAPIITAERAIFEQRAGTMAGEYGHMH